MPEKTYNVLFLCTGNSARSIMAEALLNHLGKGRFRAYSAGSHPTGQVNPLAVKLILDNGLPAADLRSKDWGEFAAPGAPRLDFIFTVCDNTAGEVCPVWLGRPVTAHWGVEDPAAATGTENQRLKVFSRVWNQLRNRISLFLDLPIEKLKRLALQAKLDEMGRVRPEETES